MAFQPSQAFSDSAALEGRGSASGGRVVGSNPASVTGVHYYTAKQDWKKSGKEP